MSLFDEDNTVQTLHRYLHPQTGYVDEPELYPTANKVSVLVFQSIDSPTATSRRRCVCIEAQKKKSEFTDTLLSSVFTTYLKFIK